MKFKGNNQGVCPCCGDENLEYGVAQFEGESMYFPWECQSCKETGEEWYSLDFIGHNVNTDDGIIEIEDDMIEDSEE